MINKKHMFVGVIVFNFLFTEATMIGREPSAKGDRMLCIRRSGFQFSFKYKRRLTVYYWDIVCIDQCASAGIFQGREQADNNDREMHS